MAAGLGAAVAGVAVLAASAAAHTVARAAARSLRPGFFVGVGIQGSWSEFLVFDLVCGIDLWIGSYFGEFGKWKISVFWTGVFARFSGGFSDWPKDMIQVLVSVQCDSV